MQNIFKESLNRFIEKERDNILSGVSERNLCGRLALIIETVAHENGLTDYYADTEYNRKQQGKIKTILDNNMREVVINCDLILHSRGKIVERDNLITLEMKKSNRPWKEKKSDQDRLRAMTKVSHDGVWSYDGITHPEHVCGYELGVYIEIDREQRSIEVKYYEKGDLTDSYSTKF